MTAGGASEESNLPKDTCKRVSENWKYQCEEKDVEGLKKPEKETFSKSSWKETKVESFFTPREETRRAEGITARRNKR